MKENWLSVVGYEGLYEVSDCGRIRRVLGGDRNTVAGRILKTPPNKQGYLKVSLTSNGVQKKFQVHRLVATAFLPNPEGMPIVAHWDNVPSNCQVGNLRWTNQRGNMADRVRHGTQLRGEEMPTAKLTEDLVMQIIADPRTHRAIASDFGVSQSRVSFIKNGKTWKHIDRQCCH